MRGQRSRSRGCSLGLRGCSFQVEEVDVEEVDVEGVYFEVKVCSSIINADIT